MGESFTVKAQAITHLPGPGRNNMYAWAFVEDSTVEYGVAWVHRDEDGRRWVQHADPRILVASELLEPGVLDPGVWEPHDKGGVLTLDSDGEYRYRMVGPDETHPDTYRFERIEDGAS